MSDDMAAKVLAGLADLSARLERIERAVKVQTPRAGYTVKDVALRLDLERWTIRQACNTGRVRAAKKASGESVVSPEELARLERQGGLDPVPRRGGGQEAA